jgi:hypothetical protein
MSRSEPVLFSETQALRLWQVRVILAFPPAALLFISCRQVLWHKPWGSPPVATSDLIFLTVVACAVYLRLITVRLVTRLRAREIEIRLKGLWKRRRIPLQEIRSAEVADYNPVERFGGYGVRTTRRGTAFLADGKGAAELVMENGQHIVIGSRNPAELVQKIMAQRKQVKA